MRLKTTPDQWAAWHKELDDFHDDEPADILCADTFRDFIKDAQEMHKAIQEAHDALAASGVVSVTVEGVIQDLREVLEAEGKGSG